MSRRFGDVTAMQLRSVLLLLALILTLDQLRAQRIWVVDATNGPGTNFTDLPPAFAAAGRGDTILVRAGSYSRASTSTPLRLVGEPGATLGSGFAFESLVITNIPAGEHFVLSGFTLPSPLGIVRLRDNRGPIIVDGIVGLGATWNQIMIETSDAVTVTSSSVGLDVRDSTVAISNCSIGPTTSGLRTLYSLNSRVFLSNSTLIGSAAPPSGNPRVQGPGTACDVRQGELSIGPSCRLRGGQTHPLNPGTAPAIYIRDARVCIDPSATITGSGAPPIIVISGPQPTFGTVAELSATNAGPGGQVSITVRAPPLTPLLLAASLPAVGVANPFGWLTLDPGTTIVFANGTTNTLGEWSTTLGVPARPTLRGTSFHLQGMVVLPTTSLLTTPGALTVL